MAVTATTFKESFPEFDLATADQDALINAKLAEAEGQVDRAIYQSSINADSAVKYLGAHLLAMSPAAVNLRLVKKDGSTLYWQNYERLYKSAAFGYRVP